MNPVIQHITAPQEKLTPLPPHSGNYEALLLACVDARKRIEDLGFGDETLMLRNIGATAYDTAATASHSPEYNAAVDNQRQAIRDAITMGVKEIFVMNHDHCGGIGCLCGAHQSHLGAVYEHLQQNSHLSGSPRDVGEEAVRISVRNLENNPDVRKAGIKVHGMIVNTATGTLKEQQPDGSFRTLEASNPDDSQLMARVRERQKGKHWSEDAPKHEPKMLMVSQMATPVTAKVLDLHGQALIYRDGDPCADQMNIGLKAATDFAVGHMGVKDVAVMVSMDDALPDMQRRLRQGVLKMEKYIGETLKRDDVTVHPWMIDRSGRVSVMNIRDGSITPIAQTGDEQWVERVSPPADAKKAAGTTFPRPL